MKTATSKNQKEKADYDSVIIPAEGLIHLEYLLNNALERIDQHKEELAKQNVPKRDIEIMYKAHEIFAHDYIEMFRMFIRTGGPHDEYIIKRNKE